jgi:hypothetical protein
MEQEEPASEPPGLLRLRLPGPEAMALVGVCRTRVLKHQEHIDSGDGGGGAAAAAAAAAGGGGQDGQDWEEELAEAAREVK